MSAERPCWSCRGLVGGEAFCPTCQAIQPPLPGADYFGLFGLEPGFEIDLDRLARVYQERQQQFHPDRFATRTATERRLSLAHVTELNEAYLALKDPLNRAGYLLARAGLGHGAGGGNAAPADPVFLMEVMEWREELAAVKLDDPRAADRLASQGRAMKQRMARELAAMSQAFARYFAGDRAGLDLAARHADRLKYQKRFLEELDRLEERVLGG